MVYGYASTETLDSQGEVVEKAAIEGALPDYMKYGNIREMHQPSAVGKTKTAKMDGKGLFIGVKVVDNNAWQKVKEGVYNGFSIGGKKLMTIENRVKKLILGEISLVDRPANPDATFSLVKFDNTVKLDTAMPTDTAEAVYSPSIIQAEDKPVEPSEGDKTVQHVMNASDILSTAREIVYLYMRYKDQGMDTSKLEVALASLKDAAKDCLSKMDMDLLDEIEKAILGSKERDNMPKGEFAYTDSKGGKHLPISDVAHVRNAMARFNQTKFESPEKKKEAAKKIIAAAKREGIDVSESSAVHQTAMGKAAECIWTGEWQPNYYQQLRKVIG